MRHNLYKMICKFINYTINELNCLLGFELFKKIYSKFSISNTILNLFMFKQIKLKPVN